MPLSFPSSPTVGQISAQNGRTYVYTSYGTWELAGNVAGHAASHAAGGGDALTLAASQITSGQLGIDRIPTGSTSLTVCVGNDARLSDARTPTSHTHSASDVVSGTLANSRLSTRARAAINTYLWSSFR